MSGLPAGDSLRRAALTLHALAEADRAWVLAGLSAPQRQVLDPLLGELRALGIPQDRSALAAVAPNGAITEFATLDGEGVAALAGVLEPEPLELTRILLAIHPWSWRAELLHRLPPQRRAALESLPAGSSVAAPKLAASALDLLAARVRACRASGGASTSRRWSRFRLAAWKGRS